MTVFKSEVSWACSYTHEGKPFAVKIVHDDPDWLNSQMSDVLSEFQIDGWYVGSVSNPADLDDAIEEAAGMATPQAYRDWCQRQKNKLN